MAPRFGTDGIRGVAGVDLTPELALALGRAAARIVSGSPFLLGRDTRQSGTMIQSALAAASRPRVLTSSTSGSSRPPVSPGWRPTAGSGSDGLGLAQPLRRQRHQAARCRRHQARRRARDRHPGRARPADLFGHRARGARYGTWGSRRGARRSRCSVEVRGPSDWCRRAWCPFRPRGRDRLCERRGERCRTGCAGATWNLAHSIISRTWV